MQRDKEKKASKLNASYKEYQEILRPGSTKITISATQCHDGPRALWLPKLENTIYQNFTLDTLLFFQYSPP